MKRIIAITFTTFALCSCTIEEHIGDIEENITEEECSMVPVEFIITSDSLKTKSSISPDEDAILDINIYAYRDGKLVDHVFKASPTRVSLELNQDCTYNFYAISNMGKIEMPTDESEIPSKVNLWIATIDDLDECIPMAWKTKGVSVTSSQKAVNVRLERLAARIGFSLDASLVNGIRMTSVRLCQSASVVRPFESGGSRITCEEESLDGDYATEGDLRNLNEGKTIHFYTLENRQDNLLPQNKDPWQKTPDALGNKAGLCTYIEAVGEFEEGFLYKGTVTYRFYLGKDNTSDFSVIRNTDMAVTLTLTGEGLTEISWKVEPDVEVQPGYAVGYIDESLHPADDMYIGEKFWYYIDVHPDLVTHLGGDLDKCSLKMVSSDGGSMKFDEYDNDSSRGVVYARGTCWSKGTGTIWLCDPSGNPVTEVSQRFNIQKPKMVASFYSSVRYGDDDIAIDEQPCAIINGRDEKLHIYLTDNDGYNLNNDYLSGFDLTPFTFEREPYIESDYDILNNVSITMTPGTSESNGPAATYTISCKNNGNDPDLNYELSRAVRGTRVISIDIDELNHEIYKVYDVDLGIEPITLTVVDNGWAKYHSTQASLKVDNPSNLPLTIQAWQVNTSNTDWNAISRNEYLDDVNNNITINRVSYITSAYYGSSLPLYGYGTTIYSERNGDGDQYTADGNLMVYPLYGLDVNDCYRVQMVDQRGQESLHHLFDVRLPSGRLYSSEVKLVDNLEDGSMKYGIIYGDDPENPGWNNKGMWLYSNGNLISKPNTSLDSFTNVTAQKLSNMISRFNSGPYNLTLTYDSSAGQLYASCTKGNPYGIKLDVSITGTVQGYVETFPSGTWFSGKDNNCSATISKTLTGITVGSSKTSIDGGAIKAGMDAIYAQTFFDSHNSIGSSNSYQHAAHPTSLNVTIKIKVNSASTADLYPITLTWNASNLSYYHSQDGKTYSPTLTKSMPTWSFNRLKRK